MSDEAFMERIEQTVFQWIASHLLTAIEKVKLVRRLFHSFRGLDFFQPLMEDKSVTEIMINSHDELFVERERPSQPASDYLRESGAAGGSNTGGRRRG